MATETTIPSNSSESFRVGELGRKRNAPVATPNNTGPAQLLRTEEVVCYRYHYKPQTYYGRVKETFGENIPIIKAGGMVLDMGCSVGPTTIELANLHKECKVIGIDIVSSDIQLKELRNNLDLASRGSAFVFSGMCKPVYVGELKLPTAILIADGFRAPFQNDTFGAVYMMNNFYYTLSRMNQRTSKEILSNVGSLLKQDGKLMISGTNESNVDFIILQRKNGKLMPSKISFSDDEHSKRLLERILASL